MKKHLDPYSDKILQLSLFTKLDEKNLEKILENAQIASCKKGKIFFSKDQKIINLNIVLSGAVKLFASNQDGDETIIKLVSDSFLNEIFDEKFLHNAQAIKDTKILTIPLKEFRENLQKFPQLALNALTFASLENRELRQEITQIKIDDAKQRVGNFLLKKSFVKGKKIENFELNFSKAEIASYLGIKPETLSRNLGKLQKDGEIAVNKNRISLKKSESLCSYCDSEISSKCSHRKPSCE